MNLFLRILIVWIKSKFRPVIAILDTCVSDFQVWFTDQDAFRHMTNSRYFSLTDVAIIDYMLRTGAWSKLSRKGWMPHVLYEDIAFRKALRWGQRFDIHTRFLGWDDTNVVCQHVFVRNDGRIAAEGLTVARFVGMKGEKIAVAQVMALIGQDGLKSPVLPREATMALARAIDGYNLSLTPIPAEPLKEAA